MQTSEIIAKCEQCGFRIEAPFPSFDIADESRCPQCGHDLVAMQLCHPDDLTIAELLRPGWQIDRVPRDFLSGILAKAFRQGLDSIDLRITFTNRYEDETKIEVLDSR